MIESLHSSIESIKDYDFSGEWRTSIYLDPEDRCIYTFTDTNCIPRTAHNGIDRFIISVSPKAIAESVYDWLSYIESDLEEILEGYKGSHWNGKNHVGMWTPESLEYLDEVLQRHPPEIATYWDAGDWFSPVESNLKAQWEEGKTAEEIITEDQCGNSIDGMCDRDEAIAWLKDKIDQWESEKEEEENE